MGTVDEELVKKANELLKGVRPSTNLLDIINDALKNLIEDLKRD